MGDFWGSRFGVSAVGLVAFAELVWGIWDVVPVGRLGVPCLGFGNCVLVQDGGDRRRQLYGGSLLVFIRRMDAEIGCLGSGGSFESF